MEREIKQKMDLIKAKIADKSRKKSSLVKPITEPRYDKVFFEGLKWLDSLSYSDNWEDNMSKSKVIEPCLYKCNLLDVDDGKCKLYNIPLDCGNIEDPYDDGYRFTYFKCRECQDRELDANIQLAIEELQMVYNNFVEEFGYITEKLQTMKHKLMLINNGEKK